MTKIVFVPEIGGFVPDRTLLRELFAAHPEHFDEPLPPEDFRLSPNADEPEVALKTITGVLTPDGLRFLLESQALRALPWLVAAIEARRGQICTYFKTAAQVFEVPDDQDWYVWQDDDCGLEQIRLTPRLPATS